jgi:hypothetical protein
MTFSCLAGPSNSKNNMPSLSESAQKYLWQVCTPRQPEASGDSAIRVDYVSSKIATLYEKLRQVIDFQEEHLLRKNTIERMLKRRLLLSLNPQEVAGPLISELIRGGYFPNDKIPETKIGEIQSLLAKYIFLIDNLPQSISGAERKKLADWLQSLAALEIEEKLVPPKKERALLDFMVQEMMKRLAFAQNLDEETKKELIFVACQKALLKSDSSLLSWWLLRLKFPEFANQPDQNFLISFANKLPQIGKDIENRLQNPFIKRILEKAYLFTPAFLLLQDVVGEDTSHAAEVFENPESLESRIKFAYDRRYRALKKDNTRTGVRWVLSILLSKMVLVFLLEVPYDRARGSFSPLALAINLFFPPFLMFLLVSSLKMPGEERKNALAWQALNIVYAKEQPETFKIQKPPEKGGLAGFVIRLVFLASSSLVFGGAVYLLLKINFSWLSVCIFLAFFSLIAFSGLRIEANTRQFRGQEKGGEILGFIADIFFLPFRTVGKWLSGQLQRYNLIILVLNLFFEAPLQIFFEFVENWRAYLKKKKEEIE